MRINSLSTRTRDQQIVDAWNFAVQYLNSQGSFWWDEYFGTIVTVTGKKTYEVTPYCTNYFPDSRGSTQLTLSNCVATLKNAASYDDTFNLTKLTSNGATPSATKLSVGTLNSRRVSGSVWLKVDTDNDPGDITLTLMDGSGSQTVEEEITNDGTLKRYGVCGYFNDSSDTVQLKISWTSSTGILWVDGWQVEDNDWPSENILNTSTTATQARTIFADPLRVHALALYKYNTKLNWTEILHHDPELYPSDHILPLDSITKYASTVGGQINLENVDAGSHIIYRGKRIPPVYDSSTSGDEVVLIPEPELWTVIRGVIAYQKAAMYDSGQNREVDRAVQAFGNAVNDMVLSSRTNPSWSHLGLITPVMMQ